MPRMLFIDSATRTPKPLQPPTEPKVRPARVDEGDVTVLERVPQRVVPPPMHQVVMLNDDYTPMEFVVEVLQAFFQKDQAQATHIMLQIHLKGRGICGVYPPDVALTKVNQVIDAAQSAGHPLQCVSEPLPEARP